MQNLKQVVKFILVNVWTTKMKSLQLASYDLGYALYNYYF